MSLGGSLVSEVGVVETGAGAAGGDGGDPYAAVETASSVSMAAAPLRGASGGASMVYMNRPKVKKADVEAQTGESLAEYESEVVAALKLAYLRTEERLTQESTRRREVEEQLARRTEQMQEVETQLATARETAARIDHERAAVELDASRWRELSERSSAQKDDSQRQLMDAVEQIRRMTATVTELTSKLDDAERTRDAEKQARVAAEAYCRRVLDKYRKPAGSDP